MTDVVIYDEHQAWSRTLNASGRDGRGVGGWEVFMVQLAEGLAAAGYSVEVCNAELARHDYVEGPGVAYNLSDRANHCRVLITGRHSRIPEWIRAERTFTACVDDPRSSAADYAHLIGRTTMVHLSEWQRSLYRELGHTGGNVIPSMISDAVYDLRSTPKERGRWCCVSAWNKGTDRTLALWQEVRECGTLYVGSPYGAPKDAWERCMRAGARWLGQLGPMQVAQELAKSEAVFRVCERPETFGVTDAIAEAVGTRVHCLCTHGFGAALEELSSPYVTMDPMVFLQGVREGTGLGTQKDDFRVSTILPRWIKALGLEA